MMTLTENTVIWMFFAVVALAALAIVSNYAIVKVLLTGRAWVLERRSADVPNVVPMHERSQR